MEVENTKPEQPDYPPELTALLLHATGRLLASFVEQSPPAERWHILACFDGLEELNDLYQQFGKSNEH